MSTSRHPHRLTARASAIAAVPVGSRPSRQRAVPALFALALAATMVAGPREAAAQGSCTSLDGIPVTYNVSFGVLQDILDLNCQGCHTTGTGDGGFLVNFDQVREKMLGPPPENGAPASSNYPGFRRVVPGRPDLSLVFLKLNCDGAPAQSGGTGGRMPLGGSLTIEEQALFYDWIRGGAIFPGDGAGDPGSDRRFVDNFEAYR